MKLHHLSFLILACFSLQAHGQLHVSNTGTKQIQVAIGYKSVFKPKDGWQTEGWFTVDPKETITVISFPLTNKYYYVYGKIIGCDGEYAGSSDLIIDPVNAFRIAQADQNSTIQANPKLSTRKFIQLDLEGKTRDTIKFVQEKCMIQGKRDGEWMNLL